MSFEDELDRRKRVYSLHGRGQLRRLGRGYLTEHSVGGRQGKWSPKHRLGSEEAQGHRLQRLEGGGKERRGVHCFISLLTATKRRQISPIFQKGTLRSRGEIKCPSLHRQ